MGLLLRSYRSGQTIEQVALSFWESRIEKTGSRFEDIVTTALIATLSSIVAGIIVEMWKGEFGPLNKLLRDDENEALRLLSRKEPTLRSDLNSLLPFYYAKENGKGVSEQQTATELYLAIGSGVPFIEYAKQCPHAVDYNASSELLKHAIAVCRGVVISEINRRNQDPQAPQFRLDRQGLPLSAYLAFGETIALFNVDDLGLGPNWPNTLREKLEAEKLYPDWWPTGGVLKGRSPKILILDESILHRMEDTFTGAVIRDVAGLISTNSGMTSHLAIMSRGLGIGAISCPLSHNERANAKFALIQAGYLRLYSGTPDLSENDLVSLLGAMNRTKFTSE